jgi:hypothetical protein
VRRYDESLRTLCNPVMYQSLVPLVFRLCFPFICVVCVCVCVCARALIDDKHCSHPIALKKKKEQRSYFT